MRLGAFDTSEVDAEIERSERHDRGIRKARAIASRAFAQGFTAALEAENSREWLEHYQERSE